MTWTATASTLPRRQVQNSFNQREKRVGRASQPHVPVHVCCYGQSSYNSVLCSSRSHQTMHHDNHACRCTKINTTASDSSSAERHFPASLILWKNESQLATTTNSLHILFFANVVPRPVIHNLLRQLGPYQRLLPQAPPISPSLWWAQFADQNSYSPREH